MNGPGSVTLILSGSGEVDEQSGWAPPVVEEKG